MSEIVKVESSNEHIESTNSDNSPGQDLVAIQNETFAINESALGNDLPGNYYRSLEFIGTIIVRSFDILSHVLRPA